MRVRQRMEVVYHKSQGKSHKEIGELVSITQTTVRTYLRLYQSGSIEALKGLKFYRPQSTLEPHQAVIVAAFEREPATTMKEAAHRIKALTEVERSPDQVRRYLTRLGLKRLKTGQLPAKADPAVQAEFLKKTDAPPGGSGSRSAQALLCRRCPLCHARVAGLPLVLYTRFHPGGEWTATLQRIRRLRPFHLGSLHRDQ